MAESKKKEEEISISSTYPVDDLGRKIRYKDDTLTIKTEYNHHGIMYQLEFTFTEEVHGFKGKVMTTWYGYEGQKESDNIELSNVKVAENYRNKGLCKPMIMYCMKNTIQHYTKNKREYPKKFFAEVMTDGGKSKESAINCYIDVFEALGLKKYKIEPSTDSSDWFDMYIEYHSPEGWNPSWISQKLKLHETDRYWKLQHHGGKGRKKNTRRKKRKTKRRKRRRKKTRKKRGRGKCASKPKYDDEKEIEERISKSIEHMKGQEQKLKEIIDASTRKDGTMDLNLMLKNIRKHQQGGRRKKTRRRK